MSLPELIATKGILSHYGIGLKAWKDIREAYNIEPVTRSKGGLVYRGIDIQNALTNTENNDYDPIMKGMEGIG